METNTSLHSLPSLQAASKAHGADDVARGALPVPTEEHGVAMVLATWQGLKPKAMASVLRTAPAGSVDPIAARRWRKLRSWDPSRSCCPRTTR